MLTANRGDSGPASGRRWAGQSYYGRREMAGLAGGRHCWIIRQSGWLSIGDLERLAAPVTLVLDDYHLISNPTLLQSVAPPVAHFPATLSLVVSPPPDPVLLA